MLFTFWLLKLTRPQKTKSKRGKVIWRQSRRLCFEVFECRRLFAIDIQTNFDTYDKAVFETPTITGGYGSPYIFTDSGVLGKTLTLENGSSSTDKELQVTFKANEDRGQAIIPIPGRGEDYLRTTQEITFNSTHDFAFGEKIHRVFGFFEEKMYFDILVVAWGEPNQGLGSRDMTGVNGTRSLSINSNFGPNEFARWIDFSIVRGKTYTMELEVQLNSINQSNGYVNLYLDQQLVISATNLKIRDEDIGVTRALVGGWYSNGVDGNTSIAPASPTSIRIDNVAVTSNPRNAKLPTLLVRSASVAEGNVGTTTIGFPVMLSSPIATPTQFDYIVQSGSAVATLDFPQQWGTFTLPAGQSQATLNLLVHGDQLVEGNETFNVVFSNARGAILSNTTVVGTILNDDVAQALPSLSVADTAVYEPDTGIRYLTFVVSLDRVAASAISFTYSTTSITANAGIDYIASTGTGTATIPAGGRSAYVSLAVLGDYDFELDEELLLTIAAPVSVKATRTTAVGRIINTDAMPTLSVADASATEDSGVLDISIRLNKPAAIPVSFDYATANMTATNPSDFEARQGTIIIGVGQTQVSTRINLVKDERDETNERFKLVITNPRNAIIGKSSGTATIINDDKWLSVYRETGYWYEFNVVTGQERVIHHGLPGDVPLLGRFDSSGVISQAVFRPKDGKVYLRLPDGSMKHFQVAPANSNYIPLVGDVRGTGIDDIIVYNPSNSGWTIFNSQSGLALLLNARFGNAGDLPLAQDMTGAGRVQIVVFRQSNGTFYVMDPLNFGDRGWAVGDGWTGSYQMPGYARTVQPIPVLGDLDGDGKGDFTLVEFTTGVWTTRFSASRRTTQVQAGTGAGVPIVFDFNSDGIGDRTMIGKANYVWSFYDDYDVVRRVQWGLPWMHDLIPFDSTGYGRRRIWGW